jgi:hypothetical protein
MPFINNNSVFSYQHDSANYRHHDMICRYLKITRWKNQTNLDTDEQPNLARYFAIQTASSAALTMNYISDVINVVIEELRNNNFEIPPFEQLVQLTKHTRNAVNRKILLEIDKQL